MNSTRPIQFFTVNSRRGPEEIKIKGSRFISFLYPVSRLSDVTEIINSLRKTFHDATHICFAYRLRENDTEHIRFHDDGEPSGTAGIPIYNQIKGKDFLNVLLVVIRYFGGTKLGTGGLNRAYGQSAGMVLDGAEKIFCQIMKRVSIGFEYCHTGEIRNLMERFSMQVIHQEYTENGVKMELLIPEINLDAALNGLRESSRGKIELKLISD